MTLTAALPLPPSVRRTRLRRAQEMIPVFPSPFPAVRYMRIPERRKTSPARRRPSALDRVRIYRTTASSYILPQRSWRRAFPNLPCPITGPVPMQRRWSTLTRRDLCTLQDFKRWRRNGSLPCIPSSGMPREIRCSFLPRPRKSLTGRFPRRRRIMHSTGNAATIIL